MTLTFSIAEGELLNVEFTRNVNDTEFVGTLRKVEIQRRAAHLNRMTSAP